MYFKFESFLMYQLYLNKLFEDSLKLILILNDNLEILQVESFVMSFAFLNVLSALQGQKLGDPLPSSRRISAGEYPAVCRVWCTKSEDCLFLWVYWREGGHDLSALGLEIRVQPFPLFIFISSSKEVWKAFRAHKPHGGAPLARGGATLVKQKHLRSSITGPSLRRPTGRTGSQLVCGSYDTVKL